MQKIRKFRAVRNWCRAGVFGTLLVLLAGEAIAQTGTADDVEPAVPEAAAANRNVTLKFYAADWAKVLGDVAEQSGSTLVMHEQPPGRLVMRHKTPFTRHEAVEILNRELQPSGFRILESHQYLIVLNQRSVRTRYRRPETPSEPEWSPKPGDVPQFEPGRTYKRSVTAIATKEQQQAAAPHDRTRGRHEADSRTGVRNRNSSRLRSRGSADTGSRPGRIARRLDLSVIGAEEQSPRPGGMGVSDARTAGGVD